MPFCVAAVPLAGEAKQAEIQAAATAEDMWKAIGKDSWVVVPIASTSRPGQLLSRQSRPRRSTVHRAACVHVVNTVLDTYLRVATGMPKFESLKQLPRTARLCFSRSDTQEKPLTCGRR